MTSDSKNTLKLKDIVVYTISIFLAIIFLYFAFKGVNFSDILFAIKNASIGFIVLLCFTQMASHYFRALRWQVILRSIKENTSSFNLLGSLMMGYAVNGVIPRLGEVTKAVSVGKLEKVSSTALLGTVVVERIIDMLFFAAAVIISGFIYKGSIYSQFPWLKATLVIGSILFVVMILSLIFTIYYKEKFFGIIVKLIAKISPLFATKAEKIFYSLVDGFASLKGVKNYFLTLLYSVLVIFFYGVTSYVGMFALGIGELSWSGFATAWVIMSISAIGVMIPTPGGIGSYHTLTKAVMVGLFSFLPGISVTYAAMTHGVTYLLHVLVAIGFAGYFAKKYPELKNLLFVRSGD